jgi:hypothetical protein
MPSRPFLYHPAGFTPVVLNIRYSPSASTGHLRGHGIPLNELENVILSIREGMIRLNKK